MAELRTRKTEASVDAFLDSVTDDSRRADCRTITDIMRRATGAEPKLWGPAIVGFGDYHYKYDSGREGDWFLTGFSPRKKELSLYIMAGFERYDDLLAKLGKYRTGKSCLYLKRLADVELTVLEELVKQSVAHTRKAWG